MCTIVACLWAAPACAGQLQRGVALREGRAESTKCISRSCSRKTSNSACARQQHENQRYPPVAQCGSQQAAAAAPSMDARTILRADGERTTLGYCLLRLAAIGRGGTCAFSCALSAVLRASRSTRSCTANRAERVGSYDYGSNSRPITASANCRWCCGHALRRRPSGDGCAQPCPGGAPAFRPC